MPPIDTKGLIGDSNALIASFLWGTVGSGFAVYGWKQKEMIPLFGGIALIAVSYFCANSALVMSLVSIAIIAGIFFLKKHY